MILYNPRASCPYRMSGRVLARLAGLLTLSLAAHAKQRGVTAFYGAIQ